MQSNLLNSLPSVAAFLMAAPGFVDGCIITLVLVGALVGLTTATEPEDPTDF